MRRGDEELEKSKFYSTPDITERKGVMRHGRWRCPCRTRNSYGLAASFTQKNIKDKDKYYLVSVKAHSLLDPILLPSCLLHLWAVAGTTAWAHSACNHWRARSSISGYDVDPQHQATDFAATSVGIPREKRGKKRRFPNEFHTTDSMESRLGSPHHSTKSKSIQGFKVK